MEEELLDCGYGIIYKDIAVAHMENKASASVSAKEFFFCFPSQLQSGPSLKLQKQIQVKKIVKVLCLFVICFGLSLSL